MTCWEPGTQPVQEQVILGKMSLTMRFLSKVHSFVEELMSINWSWPAEILSLCYLTNSEAGWGEGGWVFGFCLLFFFFIQEDFCLACEMPMVCCCAGALATVAEAGGCRQGAGRGSPAPHWGCWPGLGQPARRALAEVESPFFNQSCIFFKKKKKKE